MKPTKRVPRAAFTRRSFVERLGLGVGATLLASLARTIEREARGEVATRKIASFWVMGNGIHPVWNFTPVEFMPDSDPKLHLPILDGPKTYTWPAMFSPLEPYRSRMLLIDGLASRARVGGGGHGSGFYALSCVTAADSRPNDAGPPGGPSIDQFIASRIGTNTVRKSLLVGVSQNLAPQRSALFASGRLRAEPSFQSPSMLFSDTFGPLITDASGVKRGALRGRLLFDTLRADIERLRGSFANSERNKLDTYLETMEDFEKREKLLGSLSCTVPDAPVAVKDPEDQLESLINISTLALACGISNVLGVDIGTGFSHATLPNLRKVFVGTPMETTRFESGFSNIGHHARAIQAPALDIAYRWLGKLMARTIENLAKIRVGDSTLWDNSTFAFLSDNGEEHHAAHSRWPIAIIGNAGGKLRADGRFLRFPKRGAPGNRSMADLFCSIATACGAPTKDFGRDPEGGGEPVQGPIDLLLA